MVRNLDKIFRFPDLNETVRQKSPVDIFLTSTTTPGPNCGCDTVRFFFHSVESEVFGVVAGLILVLDFVDSARRRARGELSLWSLGIMGFLLGGGV